MEEEKTSIEELKEIIKKNLEKFTEDDINEENIENLYKLVDIYKDLENVEYWKIKEENDMRYYGDNEYSRDFSGEYGRQGMRGTGPYSRYRGGRGSGRYSNYGHYPMDMMDEMREYYMNYNEGREQYGRGNYGGGEQEMIQATEGIMKNITEIVKELSDSDNPQVMQIIQRHAQKIMEM